jgi:hypothetical protein
MESSSPASNKDMRELTIDSPQQKFGSPDYKDLHSIGFYQDKSTDLLSYHGFLPSGSLHPPIHSDKNPQVQIQEA